MFKIWIAMVILIAGILAIGFNSYRIMELNAAKVFNEQQLFLVREAARGIREFIGNLEGNLRLSADLIASSAHDAPAVEKIFSSVFSNSARQMEYLFIADSDGAILYRYPPADSFSARDTGLSALLKQASGRTDLAVSPVMTIPLSKQSVFSFIIAVPVKNSNGRVERWVCCIPDFNRMKQQFIYPIRSGKTGYAWMVDAQGMLIAHPNKSLEGKEAVAASKNGMPDFSSRRLEEIVRQKMIRGDEGTGEYVSGWHAGEKELTKKLIAYAPIRLGGIGWSIGVSTPYHEVLDQLAESNRRLALFLGCFIGTIIIGALWLLWQEKKNQQVNQYLQWSQEVFNGITDGITIVDQNYRVLMVNDAVCRWQNKPLEFFLGKPCHEVFLLREELCLGCPAKETFATGQPAFRERVSITLGGKKYYFHLYTFPLKDRNGKTVRVVEYVKDVTRERILQSEIIQNERLAIIGKMSAQVAHEIRNPLSALTLNADLLEDEIKGYQGIDSAEAQELVATIKHELKSLHNVIDEYLQFTRLPKIKLDKGDINRTLEEILTFMAEEFRAHKITMRKTFDAELPLVNIDYDQLRRAFINIIRNAREAMKEGGSLDIATRVHEKWVEITFMDSGEGISEQNLDQVFTPFFSTKVGGTGLGLSITKHIISEHQGEITCESRRDEGTRFTIRLPREEH
jgi:signal transduction histidine kinase